MATIKDFQAMFSRPATIVLSITQMPTVGAEVTFIEHLLAQDFVTFLAQG